MEKKKNKYWEKRLTQLEESLLSKGQSFNHDLEKQYLMAINSVEKDILKWYTRLAVNNNITLAQAKEMLTKKELEEFKWDVFEYIKRGKENSIDQRWMKQLENASARVHISKLEAMKIYMQQHAEVVFGVQLDGVNKLAKDIFTEGYYYTAYEIQKGFNIGWTLFPLDTHRITRVINNPWATDGRNFSSRIWNNKEKLINSLNTNLTQSIIRGESPDTAIRLIANEFNVSKRQAGRLVMTESAFFVSASQQECFNDLDVEKFQIVATLDSDTSSICQGLDGEISEMKDYEVGVTAPPFHVNCRSTTIPYFSDNYGERSARGEDGKTYYIPSNITYKEWKAKYVK